MTPLGWALAGHTGSHTCNETVFTDLVLLSNFGRLPTPRMRARAQLENLRFCDPFLPIAPSVELAMEEALEWTHDKRTLLVDRLNSVCGTSQISGHVTFDQSETETDLEASWLRRKWRLNEAHRAQFVAAERLFRRLAKEMGAKAVRVRYAQRGATFDLLVQTQKFETSKRHLASSLPKDLLQATVVGPLPAYGFSDLSEAIWPTA